jgi:epoxyqueuosine reductase
MLDTLVIKDYAYSLGFDAAQITTAQDFPEAERVIKDRIARGLMDGLPWFTAERAEVSCRPTSLLPDAQSIIALGMCYLTQTPPDSTSGDSGPRGRISRYAWGDDYHDTIKPKLRQFAQWLDDYIHKEMGNSCETRLFVDTGRMVDRAVAQRSGLGWYGKNTNILTKNWGSWLFLAAVVINVALPPDEPLATNCGSCEVCLHACPTHAFTDAYELDSTRCISYLTIELRDSIPLELRPLMGNLIFGCDICQQVCPVNQVVEKRLGLPVHENTTGNLVIPVHRIQRRSSSATMQPLQPKAEFQPRPTIGSAPELIPLLSLTEEQFRERFRRSPIKRAKRRGLLRNVCVALGNSGDQRAIPALINALHDDEPLIRGHAAWALGRLGGDEARQALLSMQEIEKDPNVQQEILLALSTHLLTT